MVRSWIRSNGPLVGAILETRTQAVNADNIVQATFSGWRWEGNYEYSDNGRIWVVSDPAISLIVYKKSAQFILCGIKDPASGVSFTAAFIYAYNTETHRKDLWREIGILN